MPLSRLLIFNLILLPIHVFSQEWEKTHSIELSQTPTAYSTDIQGNIYLGFGDGRMTKYDSYGNEILNYSLSNLSSITLIDAQNSLKLFLFYFDNQQITVLDRFSSVPKNYYLSDFDVSLGMLACPSPDGNYWVVENNPQRLKKIDPLRQSLIMEVQTALGNKISNMRAYQNILLIADENGLHVFDQFGTKLNAIENLAPSHFQVIGEHLFTYYSDQLFQIDPFKGMIISSQICPEKDALGVLKLKEQYVFIMSKKLIFYKLRS